VSEAPRNEPPVTGPPRWAVRLMLTLAVLGLLVEAAVYARGVLGR
jgi:hypothetical protein